MFSKILFVVSIVFVCPLILGACGVTQKPGDTAPSEPVSVRGEGPLYNKGVSETAPSSETKTRMDEARDHWCAGRRMPARDAWTWVKARASNPYEREYADMYLQQATLKPDLVTKSLKCAPRG